MNIHSIQHVSFEGLGSIEEWVQQNAHTLTSTRTYLGEVFPTADGLDLLIVMGGPMSVHDEKRFPWLTAEKRCIEQAIERGRKVLGICLGAQLIASVLGASVYANTEKEIGWFPVETTDTAADNSIFTAFPRSVEAFHWHGETFDLPRGAIHMVRSQACEHQAFVVKDRIVGLQFHLETTSESARQLIVNCAEEIVPGRYIQDAPTLAGNTLRFDAIRPVMYDLLDALA